MLSKCWYLIVFIQVRHGPVGIRYAHALEFRLEIEKVPTGRSRDLLQAGRVVEAIEILDVNCA